MSEEIKIITIHQSLVQPVLVAGAERELIILIGFTSAIVWVAGKDINSLILSGIIWLIGSILAREAAKIDPQLTKIFFRHIKYRDYYPAGETSVRI